MFVTFYDQTYISVYKVYRTIVDGVEYLNADNLNDYNSFGYKIIEFDTHDTSITLLFSGQNTIEMYRIENAYDIEYIRVLPFFKYRKDYEFYFNEDHNLITFARLERFLYVIMRHKQNKNDKKLF